MVEVSSLIMAKCNFSLFLLSLVAFLEIFTAAQSQQTYYPTTPSGPRVSIEKTNHMSPTMQLDATDFLKRALSLTTRVDRCSIFRQLFAEKYPEYTWHVVIYKAFAVKYIKSIDLKVDNDHYFLFATKK